MKTSVNLAGIEMKNPITVASGTFGYGREFSEFIDLNKLRRNCNKRNIFKAKTRK
jgi:dihydroorotate dehydrogenase (NAD+) catalytic subunit